MLRARFETTAANVPVTVAYDRRTGDLLVTVDPSCPDGPERFDMVNDMLRVLERLNDKPPLRSVV